MVLARNERPTCPLIWFDRLTYEKRGHTAMPANAGIQRGEGPPPTQPWIPAYAGMTVDGCTLTWFDKLTTSGVYLSAHPRIRYGAGSEPVEGRERGQRGPACV